MNILIVRTHPTKININSYNVQEIGLARALARKGHKCDIVFFTDNESKCEEYVIDENHKINIFWKKGKNILWQGFFNFNQLIEMANQYDVVQLNEYNQIATYFLAKKCNKRCLIYHGPYYNPTDIKYNTLNKMFDALFLSKMKKIGPKILAKSEMAEESLKCKGFENIETVGVGLDVGRFSKIDYTRNFSKNKKTLLYIGEISERRNTLFLLSVFRKVREKNNSVDLVLIGKGKEEYQDKCNKYIKQHGLSACIKQIISVDQSELAQHYLSADIFLFPTNYDIFGMVLLEAMYFGLPVISSKNGGAVTLIEESGKEGIVIESYDEYEWENTIENLLYSEQKCKEISECAKRRISEKFTWDAIADRFLAAYQE